MGAREGAVLLGMVMSAVLIFGGRNKSEERAPSPFQAQPLEQLIDVNEQAGLNSLVVPESPGIESSNPIESILNLERDLRSSNSIITPTRLKKVTIEFVQWIQAQIGSEKISKVVSSFEQIGERMFEILKKRHKE